MDWLKSSISKSVPSVGALSLSNSKPSVLYQIKTAPSVPELLSVQMENLEAIIPDNVALAHLRIRASAFLIAQILPVLYRLEYYLSDHRKRSNSLRARRVILRVSPVLSEAERLDALADSAQSLLDGFHSFVGLHVQATDAIRQALRSNRSDDLAHAIVASCRQAGALYHAVQSSTTTSELRGSVAEILRRSLVPRDVSEREHVAGQLDQFWNQNDSGKRFGAHDVRITLRLIERELINISNLTRDLLELVGRELSPRKGFMRHPVQYTGLTSIAAYATHTVAARVRFLGGTGSFEDGVVEKMEALKLFVVMNIIEPSWQLYEQVFIASPVAASEESVAAAKSAVRDLLVDFTRKHLSDVPGALELAENGSMKAMFDLIRKQAGTPVRSLLQGSLAQAMLIQIQKVKCDVEELMIKTKQTLRAQELNLALVALVPSLLSGAILAYLLSTASFHWRNRGREMVVSGGQTANFLLADIQCSLLSLEGEEEKGHHRGNISSLISYAQHVGIIHMKIMELYHLIHRGVVSAPPKVLLRFQNDLANLQETKWTWKTKRRHVERMLSCYSFMTDA